MKRTMIIFGLLGFFWAGGAFAHQLAKVNINTADVKQLLTLKGIGQKKAAAIVNERKQHGSFHAINELTHIRGIGPHYLQKIISQNSGRILLKSE